MFPNENVGTVPPVVKSAVPVRRGRAALVPSADNPDLSMKIASTTQVIKCILSFFSGLPRCRDMRMRDVRQAAPEHGAGPREDRTPTHCQNR